MRWWWLVAGVLTQWRWFELAHLALELVEFGAQFGGRHLRRVLAARGRNTAAGSNDFKARARAVIAQAFIDTRGSLFQVVAGDIGNVTELSGIGKETAASAQAAALEEDTAVDWAAFSEDVTVYEVNNEGVQLPQDQQEDDFAKLKQLEKENRDVPAFVRTAAGQSFYRVQNSVLQYLLADGSYAGALEVPFPFPHFSEQIECKLRIGKNIVIKEKKVPPGE